MAPATADKRIALAAIAGAHGIKGEVRLKLFADSVVSLAAHDEVYVDGRKTRLLSVRDGKVPIAIFDGIADRTAAEAMRGQLVEVDRDSLPDLDDGEFYYADLIGLTCFSTDGDTIGSVLSVENFGAGEVLEIELAAGGRAMVPFRDGIADLVDARIVLDPAFLA